MDFATRFTQHVKSYFDRVSNNVWGDLQRNLVRGKKWDEDNILRTSILRDGLEKQQDLDEANKNPVYNLEVKTRDFGGQLEETLTGADLAVIFQVKINKTVVSQKLVLVQLKRAFFADGKTAFPKLHHRSGASYFGKALHQAQKMLLFTNTPVYWFAMSAGILEDPASFALYTKDATLKTLTTINYAPAREHEASFSSHIDPFLSLVPRSFVKSLASLSADELREYIEYYSHFHPYRHLFHRLGSTSLKELQTDLKHAEDHLPYQYWQLLRTRLQECSDQNFGMPARLGLFVLSAENVLALANESRHSFADVFPGSIPFSQFMLRNVLTNEYGDSNRELVTAVLENDVNRYFRERIRQLAEVYGFVVPQSFGEARAVNSSIVITQQIRIAAGEEA